jgi:hypothetical protein
MGTPPKPEFVLFISNCSYSMNFLNKLKMKDELMKKFNIVDINNIPTIPNEIEEVPSVYDGKNLYQGKDAFKWLSEKSADYLSAANDGLMYSFLDGQEEKVFGGYSLLEQKNGSFGMGEPPPVQSGSADPTRMAVLNNVDNKNRSLDALMASRSSDMKEYGK